MLTGTRDPRADLLPGYTFLARIDFRRAQRSTWKLLEDFASRGDNCRESKQRSRPRGEGATGDWRMETKCRDERKKKVIRADYLQQKSTGEGCAERDAEERLETHRPRHQRQHRTGQEESWCQRTLESRINLPFREWMTRPMAGTDPVLDTLWNRLGMPLAPLAVGLARPASSPPRELRKSICTRYKGDPRCRKFAEENFISDEASDADCTTSEERITEEPSEVPTVFRIHSTSG